MTKRDLLDALKDVPDETRVVAIFYNGEGLPHTRNVVKFVGIGSNIKGEKIANIEFFSGCGSKGGR